MNEAQGSVNAREPPGGEAAAGGGAARASRASGNGEEEEEQEQEQEVAERDCPAGKQKNPSKKGVQFVTPQQCLDIMREMKRKGRAPYWQDLEPVIASKGKGPRQCYLQCIKEAGICGALLSVMNPAERAKVHFKASACRTVRQAEGQAFLTESVQTSKRESSQLWSVHKRWRTFAPIAAVA